MNEKESPEHSGSHIFDTASGSYDLPREERLAQLRERIAVHEYNLQVARNNPGDPRLLWTEEEVLQQYHKAAAAFFERYDRED